MDNQPNASQGANLEAGTINLDKPAIGGVESNPANTVDETAQYFVQVQCSIRRRAGLTALPGLDPNEKVYKLAAALSAQSGKNLKGVDTELEQLLLPSIIHVAHNDLRFALAADEYWGNIGVIIPADELFKKEAENGKVLKFGLHVTGTRLKELIEKENNIEIKFNTICEGILNNTVKIQSSEQYADFLLLGFAIKNRQVANDQAQVAMSPHIKYYIYNKTSAVKKQLNKIEIKNKATAFFTKVQNDDILLDAMLVMFDKLPASYETTFDKVIALDEEYSKDVNSMEKLLSFENDKDIKFKYMIRLAVQKNRLKNPANTDSYYYNEVLIGRTMAETIAYLRSNEPQAENIKTTLKTELGIK